MRSQLFKFGQAVKILGFFGGLKNQSANILE
jgi:hypothetical protein